MNKKFMITGLILLVLSGNLALAATGESSAWNAVTYDSTISFSATLNADGTVSTSWSKYNHAEAFTYYKVVRSQENNNPVYPDDSYIYYGGDVNVLTYTDTEVPDGTSYYRICEIASPQRYCSSKVVTINKTAGTTTVTTPATTTTSTETTSEPTSEKPVPTLYTSEPVTMLEGFEDVPADHWAADCIEKLAGEDIIAKTSATYYRPEDSVNRAEFLKLVMKTYYPYIETGSGTSCFSDVSGSAWYAPYVCEAKARSVVSGYANNSFNPARLITRAEGTSILVNSLGLPLTTNLSIKFTDVSEPWQKQVIATAYAKQLVNGYTASTFGPNDHLTRAQAAKLICNARSFRAEPVATEYAPQTTTSTTTTTTTEPATTTTTTTTNPATPTSAITINHSNTDLAKIPAGFIADAKSQFKIAYGHTSHGSQLTTGMELLKGTSGSTYYFSADGNGGLYYNESLLTGDLGGDWESQTRALLANNTNNINLVIWSWCGQLTSMTTAEVSDYLYKMSQLEKDYPNVKFVYMTGHLDGSGESGNLHKNNEQIRNYARTNNKILFDFADIESYNPDGLYFLNLGATDGNDYNDYSKNWATEWCSANGSSALCSANSCAHSTSLNCNLKGRAFWWMMARLAGWGGV